MRTKLNIFRFPRLKREWGRGAFALASESAPGQQVKDAGRPTRGAHTPCVTRRQADRGRRDAPARWALSVAVAMGLLLTATPQALALSKHTFSTSFAGPPTLPLVNPTAVAVDQSTGDVYVANPARSMNARRSSVNATGGTFTLTFEGQTTDPISFKPPPRPSATALKALFRPHRRQTDPSEPGVHVDRSHRRALPRRLHRPPRQFRPLASHRRPLRPRLPGAGRPVTVDPRPAAAPPTSRSSPPPANSSSSSAGSQHDGIAERRAQLALPNRSPSPAAREEPLHRRLAGTLVSPASPVEEPGQFTDPVFLAVDNSPVAPLPATSTSARSRPRPGRTLCIQETSGENSNADYVSIDHLRRPRSPRARRRPLPPRGNFLDPATASIAMARGTRRRPYRQPLRLTYNPFEAEAPMNPTSSTSSASSAPSLHADFPPHRQVASPYAGANSTARQRSLQAANVSTSSPNA